MSGFAERLDALIEEELARRRDAQVPTVPVSAAAKQLGISDRTLRRRIAEGAVEAVTVLGSLRIRQSELDRIKGGLG
jgi:excisionase family DNA binding protein